MNILNSHNDVKPPLYSTFPYSEICKRKIIPRNIVQKLFARQYFVTPKLVPFRVINKFHQNLVPNFSIENAERPTCYLRKFTYDGRYLIAFSADITNVEVFEYQGPAAAAHLLANISSNQDYLDYRGEINTKIRINVFNCFFKKIHSINVTLNGEPLNRECTLFTENHRFLIVASASLVNEGSPSYRERRQNNESFHMDGRLVLEDYTFHLVDIVDGKVTDRLEFKIDKIYLSYNQGIFLYKNTFAILSVQHQTIHIYHISQEGKFIIARKIGRFCYEEDEYIIQNATKQTSKLFSSQPISAFREVPYNCLKHRLLVFMFNHAKYESNVTNSIKPLKEFYKNFNLFTSLRMWRMQLLDDEHILIKYEQEDALMRNNEAASYLKFRNMFVVYNWKTTKILNIYPQFSDTLLYAYENFCDYFRHPSYYICSPSNNYYAREDYEDFKSSLIEAKNGSYKDSVRVILSSLPHYAQSLSPSPYLDMSLFSYDEKMICTNEKPRHTSEIPIRFYDRDTGRLLFRLHTGQIYLPPQPRYQPHSQNVRRLIAFIFHPTDPFIISVLRYNSHYLVHFHIRHSNPT